MQNLLKLLSLGSRQHLCCLNWRLNHRNSPFLHSFPHSRAPYLWAIFFGFIFRRAFSFSLGWVPIVCTLFDWHLAACASVCQPLLFPLSTRQTAALNIFELLRVCGVCGCGCLAGQEWEWGRVMGTGSAAIIWHCKKFRRASNLLDKRRPTVRMINGGWLGLGDVGNGQWNASYTNERKSFFSLDPKFPKLNKNWWHNISCTSAIFG